MATQVERVCFHLDNPLTVWDNRDGGNIELAPGNYSCHPQVRQNLTLYYVYKADDNYVPQGYSILHCWLRVEDDSSINFGN